MVKNLYDKDYYQQYSHYLNRNLDEVPLFAKIREWVKKERPARVLDVGCGIGYLLSWLCQKTGSEGWGIDSSKEAINQATKLYSRINFSLGEVTDLPFEDKFFDCVLMANLIEHLEEKKQKKALAEAKRVLKDKGLLIVSTPDKNSLYARFWIHDPTHKKELNRSEVIKLVGKDFRVEEVVYTNSIGRFGKKLNFFLSRLMPADILVKAER